MVAVCRLSLLFFFFFQAEDGIRDLVRSRGLGDVYKRQPQMIDGLALGETTPGPLIMVVAFVGFVGGWTKQVLSLIHI